ncbi:hypothetical protein LCI18_013649 [Fusarium solani-melongenae]|uniref:Uncharacterized protein n=1 Tax=Fusarium solani subsp. cucurbitae TaxID=2747967 RepID=A0ACD3ZMY3_FUSSC|nr:hypothetical protein LCI18_013649 [Fusarium solani-melongenae]
MRLLPKTQEDRPTPKEVYNFKTYLFAAIASAGAATIGYDSAFIGGTIALDSFKDEFQFENRSTSEVDLLKANIVSCYQAGAFFGALAAYPAGHFLGRRLGMLIFGPIFLLGAAIMLAINNERGFALLYAGRAIAGLSIGAISNLIPIYISEISPPAIRGRLVGMWEVGWQSGGLVGFWINYAVSRTLALSYKQWLIPFAVQLIPASILILGALVSDESPRWLIANGKREKGLRVLSKLRNLPLDHPYMEEEIAQIDLKVARKRNIQWRMFLAGSLFFWQNGSGINAINYYSPTVFKSIGIVGTNASLLSTGIFGVIKTVMTVVWILVLIDQVGRRNLLIYGALGGSISLWMVGGYVAVAKPSADGGSAGSPGGTMAMAFFYIYTIFYTPSWSGTPCLGQAFAAANNWFWNFIVARFTPQMFTHMGFGVFFLFAALQLASMLYVWLFMPETKGVPLEKMDMLFDQGLKPWRAHKAVMKQLQELDSNNINSGFEQKVLDKEESDHLEKVEKV